MKMFIYWMGTVPFIILAHNRANASYKLHKRGIEADILDIQEIKSDVISAGHTDNYVFFVEIITLF